MTTGLAGISILVRVLLGIPSHVTRANFRECTAVHAALRTDFQIVVFVTNC
jgi:hypothetical protein